MNERTQPRDFAPNVDPLDDPDPFDPTGYYARKTKHREEMLAPLAWFIGIGLALSFGIAAWQWLFH